MRKKEEASTLKNAARPPPYFQIFRVFFKIGLFTLGGGLAMVSSIRHELSIRKRWVNEDRFMEDLTVSASVPGAIAVNLAFVTGNRLRRTTGALVAILGAVLPSFLVILFIVQFFLPYFSEPIIQAFFKGASTAVLGLIAYVAFIFGRRILHSWQKLFLTALALGVVLAFHLNPFFAILISVVVGYFIVDVARNRGHGID